MRRRGRCPGCGSRRVRLRRFQTPPRSCRVCGDRSAGVYDRKVDFAGGLVLCAPGEVNFNGERCWLHGPDINHKWEVLTRPPTPEEQVPMA